MPKTFVSGVADITDREFEMFKNLIFQKSGISLHEGKKELVRTRLSSRLRERGFNTYMEYYNYVRDDDTGTELISLLDAISTNLTSFFREINHFHFLAKTIIPEIVAKKRMSGSKEVRAWSAGCSSGEEPYSIAFTMMDHMETIQTWDVKILGTDLSTQVLEKAARGVYKETQLQTVPKNIIRKYFEPAPPDGDLKLYRVRDEVKRIIFFKRFNLMTPKFPFKRKFDFIFCRNVMIYFDKPTQQTLINKYYDTLAEGGYLLIGHSESLTGVSHKFKYVQPTIYQKA